MNKQSEENNGEKNHLHHRATKANNLQFSQPNRKTRESQTEKLTEVSKKQSTEVSKGLKNKVQNEGENGLHILLHLLLHQRQLLGFLKNIMRLCTRLVMQRMR